MNNDLNVWVFAYEKSNIKLIEDETHIPLQVGAHSRDKFCKLTDDIFDNISEKFEKAGYKLPRLTFWNVNSRSNTIPMRENDNGIVLVSGFSPSSIKAVMSGELDPYKALLACITVPRYDRVVDAIKRI